LRKTSSIEYYEPFFGTLADQFSASDNKRFAEAKSEFEKLIKEVNENKKVTDIGRLREQARSICASLEVIGKSAEDFLESKRTQFGRFYFVSNDELIQMLASHKNPKDINPFINNLFGADFLMFDEADNSLVTGMKTDE
jgi:dynein heavy chain